jgi:uncharacterized protein (DUF2062 family)
LAFRDRLREVIKLRESPHKVALAFATGVFIGMSPLLGLHTLIGFAVVWIFRLNPFATLAGVYITNPWTVVPIYTFSTWVGTQCLGIEQIIPEIDWSNLTFINLLNDLEPLLIPFIFGTLLMGFITSVISYIIIYTAVKKAHRLASV